MRNPNGYGSVYKLSGKRRKPFAARITIGFKKTEKSAQPIYKYIGYFENRADAMRALALYNGEGLDEKHEPTLYEVYEEWTKEKFPTLKEYSHYVAAFKAVSSLNNRKISTITIRNYEDAFVDSGRKKPTLTNTKIVLKFVYEYAFRRGYINTELASIPSFIKIPEMDPQLVEESKRKHVSFTREELEALWKHKDDEVVKTILFLIYTGVRISELINLKVKDVHLEEQYFEVIDSKTKAGIRTVPIADKILPIAKEWKEEGLEDFVPMFAGGRLLYQSYLRWRFIPTCERILGKKHYCHDTRHTTTTFLTEEGVDQRYIKLIVGHKQGDVTNDVYANKLDVKVLLKAINQMP